MGFNRKYTTPMAVATAMAVVSLATPLAFAQQADATGEFMFGITMGYEIRHGKLGRAIRDTTVSGVAFDMLKTVDMVGDTVVWGSSGFCGKKQPMPVGLGGPALRCRITMGGR